MINLETAFEETPYLLLCGDSLDRLKDIPDNSIDAIVTDCPYGLGKEPDAIQMLKDWIETGHHDVKSKSGFMQKSWDAFVPQPVLWNECLRVLKPGGHLLSFAGTRTYDLVVLGLRLAGFEIRDQLAWVYGCLSEDTQIVTKNGIKNYTEVKPTDLILCYDKYNGEYSYQPVEEVYEYRIKDTAYRIQSDFTDQIVSRNHRCIVERDGKEVFEFAEFLNKTESVPFLENLSGMQKALHDIYSGTGNKKQNMFSGMQKRIDWDKKRRAFNARTRTRKEKRSDMCSLRDTFLSEQKTCGSCRKSCMFTSMQWQTKIIETCSTFPRRACGMDSRINGQLFVKNDRFWKSRVERWCNIPKAKGKLQRRGVYSMPSRFFRNGSERWVCNGTSFECCHCDRSGFIETRSCTSYKSRSQRQQIREFDVVQEQFRPQTIREWGGHKTTLANVTEFEYDGIVWCVKVPTGSFVAVRNGMAFVTGNSGMPKALDVSKSIDKELGAERKVIGKRYHPTLKDKTQEISGAGGFNNSNIIKDVWEITEPATEEAKQWDGWKSSLKPAQEPIVMARKPLEGTIAQNVLKWHTGALNIDACRVEHVTIGDGTNLALNSHLRTHINGGNGGKIISTETEQRVVIPDQKGRFPSNFTHDGSDEVTSLFPDSNGAGKSLPQVKITGYGDKNTGTGKADYIGGDRIPFDAGSGSAARFFYCAKASKADRDSGLDDVEKKQSNRLASSQGGGGGWSKYSEKNPNLPRANNHPTVKPTSLMSWLVTLVTPPDGIVLDPFNGSGSTGKAAMINGFKYIGIDLSQDYIDISKRRIQYAYDNKETLKKELTKKVNDVKVKPVENPTSNNSSLIDLFQE